MANERILIIEDEVKIARFLELELKYEGYEVEKEHDGRSGLDKALSKEFDLIILDLMLPMLNGMEVCRRIRKVSEIPIIMLTAKGETMDVVNGLDNGADDYMTKPFAIEELLARIRVALKKKAKLAKEQPENLIKVGNITLDLNKYQGFYEESLIELTKTEFDLLYYLMSNKNIALTRDQIVEKVWGYDYMGDTNIVDVYIRYLRTKIDDKFKVKNIFTVRSVGYMIKE